MAATNSSGIAWPRLAAESAIIIASILLALGVDEWRQERNDRELEREYLGRLTDDLETNLGISELQLRSHAHKVKFARLVYPLVSRGEWKELDSVSAIVASYFATPAGFPEWTDDTYEELVSSGRIGLIRNVEIRRSLLGYYRYLETEDWTYQFMSTAYRDAIRARMDPELQLTIRENCGPQTIDCRFDIAAYETDEYLEWLTSNQELTEGLNRVIVQWTRAATEYLPEVQVRTSDLKQQIETELLP